MRPPPRRDAIEVIDTVYEYIRAGNIQAADNYLRQAVHIGITPYDLIIEATRRDPL